MRAYNDDVLSVQLLDLRFSGSWEVAKEDGE